MNAVPAPDAAALGQQLADYVCGELLERIGPAAVARTKQIIAAHVGLAFRALRQDGREADYGAALARELSGGVGSASILGHREKATLADAVLANCALIQAPGQDDVLLPAGVHPGLLTVPLALGLAEQTACSGAEVIAAIVAAYEVMGKLGRWASASGLGRRATAPLAAMGAVTLVGRLLGLNREQMAIALGYGGMTGMPLAEGGSSAGPVTHYYGLVCRTGLACAYIAKSGGACIPPGLEAPSGFLETYFGAGARGDQALAAMLGRDYEVLKACEKRYPGAALNQVVIERMRGLVAEQGLAAAHIARIAVTLPLERKTLDSGAFKGPFTARGPATSSVPFQLALILLGEETDPWRFADLGDPRVKALADLTEVDFTPGRSLAYVSLEVLTREGRRLCAEGDAFSQPPESPRALMRREAAGVLPPARIDRFVDLLETLEDVDDAGGLIRELAP